MIKRIKQLTQFDYTGHVGLIVFAVVITALISALVFEWNYSRALRRDYLGLNKTVDTQLLPSYKSGMTNERNAQ